MKHHFGWAWMAIAWIITHPTYKGLQDLSFLAFLTNPRPFSYEYSIRFTTSIPYPDLKHVFRLQLAQCGSERETNGFQFHSILFWFIRICVGKADSESMTGRSETSSIKHYSHSSTNTEGLEDVQRKASADGINVNNSSV